MSLARALFLLGLLYPCSGQQISPEEEEITLTSGATYTLNCTDSSPITWLPPHSYDDDKNDWRYRIKTSHDYKSGTYYSTLTITHAHYLDTGFYQCSPKDHPPETPPNIYIYVRDNENLLAVDSQFKMLDTKESDSVVIPCKPTSSDVNVTLWRDDHLMEGVSYSPYIGFTLASPRVVDSAILTCKGTRDHRQNQVLFQLVVNQRTDDVPKPIITAVNPPTSHAVEGQDFIADCSIMVAPGIHIILFWIPPDHNRYSQDRIVNISSSNSKLHNGISYNVFHSRIMIKNVRKHDEGKYICKVEDYSGNTNEDSYLLKVDAADAKYLNLRTDGSSEIIVRIGERMAQWIVSVSSNPPAKLIWYNPNGKEIPSLSDKYSVQNQVGKSKVQVKQVSVEDSGVYLVVAENGQQKKTLNITLLVEDKPHIKFNYESYFLFGNEYKLRCSIIAYPIPVVKWTFKKCVQYPSCETQITELMGEQTEMPDGVHLESVVTLVADVTGKLTCEARNHFGNASSSIDFLVTDVRNGFDLWGDNILVVGEDASFTCATVVYHYIGHFEWFHTNTKNQTIQINELNMPGLSLNEQRNNYSFISNIHIKNISKDISGNFTCKVYTKHNSSSYEKSLNLFIKEMLPPVFLNKTNLNGGMMDTEPGQKVTLNCYVSGSPPPLISWFKDGKKVITKEDDTKLYNGNQTLEILRMSRAHSGVYMCIARNKGGTIRAEKTLNLDEADAFGLIVLIIGLIMFGLLSTVAIIFLCLRIKRERKKFKDEMSFVGLYNFSEGQSEILNPNLDISEQAEFLPYHSKWEFPREKLQMGQQLGSGAFGVVIKAKAHGLTDNDEPTTVAVKMVKRNSNIMMIKNLASELKILAHLGKHLNVVNLIGACTDNINNRELLVIVEYCKYGNLHNYLQRHRSTFINQVDPKTGWIEPLSRFTDLYRSRGYSDSHGYSRSVPQTTADATNETSANTMVTSISTPVGEDGYLMSKDETYTGYYLGDYKLSSVGPICTQDLLCWAYQVAKGMEYLASRKVLHGDLAARNVLLAEGNVVKICDFGLAKNMYKDDNYCKKGTELLPVKWMSIEAIRDRIFSTQSDIWAFGVVLWEFFSLARTPYPGIRFGQDFLNSLVGGYRLEKPEYSPDKVYTLMLECWNCEPMLRPTFTQCAETLGQLIEQSIRQHYTELNEVYLQFNAGLADEADYLAMLNAPTFENLTSMHNEYISEPLYLNMQKGKKYTENADKVELKPMLPKDNLYDEATQQE